MVGILRFCTPPSATQFTLIGVRRPEAMVLAQGTLRS